MNTLQKGFVAPLLLVIVLLLVGGGTYVYMHKKQINRPVAESSGTQATSTALTSNQATSTMTVPAVPSQLAIDLSTVTPQFVDENGYGEGKDGKPLPKYMMEIKKDIAAYFPASQEGYRYYSRASNIYLIAIGKRYVFFGDMEAKAGTPDVIFDSVTQTSTTTQPWMAQIFKTDKFAVYVRPIDICTYTLDQPSCVPLPGARLSGGEYWDPMGGSFGITETHTNTSLTIGVFDGDSPVIEPKTGLWEAKELRTFVLP